MTTGMVARLLGAEVIVLESPLSPVECTLRLQATVRSRWEIFRVGAIVGRADGANFRIRNTGRRNFQLIMRGQLQKAAAGTRVICRLKRNPAHFIGSGIFACAVLAMFVIGVVGASADPQADKIPQVIIPMLFFLFMGSMGVHEFIRSKDDRDILLDFLQRVAEARLVGGQEPATVEHRVRR
jgi:hypothetical protein